MWLDCRPWTVSKNYGGKKIRQKKKPTGCPRCDPLFGCCPWTMTSKEFGDCLVKVSTFLSHSSSVGFCVSSVGPGRHSGAYYQCKEGSRYVEITVSQVGGVECSMCPKIVFNQNLAMFQQSCQENSIVSDRRVVQKLQTSRSKVRLGANFDADGTLTYWNVKIR